jgi:tricorn protease
MKKFISILILVFITAVSFSQSNPLWMRYPAISPDGNTIAFGYKGDIYTVSSKGGVATPLTIHDSHDMMPVWSRDGKSIAFASDRFGNFDVFIMPFTGGEATRLTYNSSGDYPYDFSVDNKTVIFGSSRQVSANNIRFYSPRLFQNLYKVSVTGGRPILISEAGIENAHYNSKGTQIVYQDRKGYEDPWRKHHTSSVTRDIWMIDLKTNAYSKLSGFEGEDREPVFSSDDQFVYYLSEKNGNQNIFKAPIQQKIAEKQLTQFKNHPVRHLSASNNNTLCFTYDGSIYTMKDGGKSEKVSIHFSTEMKTSTEKNISVNGGVSEMSVNPNGKEIAFVNRGEVFVTSIDGATTKRITNTAQQERMVEWSPDGKTLIYAAERNNNWDIYKATIIRKEESYFYASTLIKEEPLIATQAEEYQATFSPDGKEIAYVSDRNILMVYNVASKKSRTIMPAGSNYSYADGDWQYSWSPDSKWIMVESDEGYIFAGALAVLFKVDGTDKKILSQSGFGIGGTKWNMAGKLITYGNSKEGKKSVALQGPSEVDIYGIFLNQKEYDKFILNKDDYALAKEKEDADKKADTSKAKKDSTLHLDFNNLENRKVRLTISSSNISDYYLNKDGSKLYYMASVEGGYDLWLTEPRTRDTKILAKLGSSPSPIIPSKDGKHLFIVNNGRIMKIDAESGKPSAVSISGEMILDAAGEREYIFTHTWRQVKEKFYDPKIHGIDWEMYKNAYAKFLPHINNNYDFQELLSEILGELNASHTGGRYRPSFQNADNTAALGLLYDETYSGIGLKIGAVIENGPLDNASSKIKAGNIIEKIDGVEITDNIDWSKLLNRKIGQLTLLSIYNPADNSRWDETVKPISFGAEAGLMYKRWTNMMFNMVDKLSGGKVGYVHVQGMNDGSYRTVYDEVMGKNRTKEALIVDTRFNGGGWLHNDLNTFLSGKKYLEFAPQGNRVKSSEPFDRWSKPSCVVMSEGNYSDAFIFPYIYKQNGLGKLIGKPVAGTGTAVWWETQIDPSIVFGIPMVATIGKENRPTENLQVNADIDVDLPYASFINGKDPQIEAAVKEMLKVINK